MKRTLSMALILGLCATASMAVESVNTVGYRSFTSAVSGLVLIGAPFSVVGDETTPLALDEALSGTFAAGDKVYVFNGSGYTTFQYSNNLFDPTIPGFVGPGWGTLAGAVADLSMTVGDGFWLQTAAATPVTTSGQVRETQVLLNSTAGSPTLFANPYPEDVDLNDVTMTGVAAGDKVYLYNGSGYDTLQYSNNLFDPTIPGFVGPGWGTLAGAVTDTTLLLGEGFWIQTGVSVEITFPTVL